MVHNHSTRSDIFMCRIDFIVSSRAFFRFLLHLRWPGKQRTAAMTNGMDAIGKKRKRNYGCFSFSFLFAYKFGEKITNGVREKSLFSEEGGTNF